MNKKLFSFLLLVIAAFTTAFAQEELTVYDGTKTSVMFPPRLAIGMTLQELSLSFQQPT